MVDPEAVHRRLREIDGRLAALREIQAKGEKAFLGDQTLQAASERHLQIAIQSAVDIAIHIVAEDSSETPEEYAAAFVLLARIGIIGEELAESLASAARLRNMLVHLYLDVDPLRLWDHLGRIADLEPFAAAVTNYIGSAP